MFALPDHLPPRVARDTTFITRSIPARIAAGIPAEVLLRHPDIQQAELELMAAGRQSGKQHFCG